MRAGEYVDATEWLLRAKAAYRAADQTAEWKDLYQMLHTQHGRKRKLMGLFEKMGL